MTCPSSITALILMAHAKLKQHKSFENEWPFHGLLPSLWTKGWHGWGARMGEEWANKALRWSFSALKKRGQRIVGLTASVTPHGRIGTKHYKISFWNQILIKGEHFSLPPLTCEDYTEGPSYEQTPCPLFPLLSLSIETKPLKLHTVLSIKTKTT